jgi:hypothetical protein
MGPTIKYSKSLVFKKYAADNKLDAYVNPDTPPGKGGLYAQVYGHYANGYVTGGTDTIDIFGAVSQCGNSVPFAVIGTNFQSSGKIAFAIVADGIEQSYGGPLSAWSTTQWAFTFVKS